MRKLNLFLAVVACALLGASQVRAADICSSASNTVTNCGFETGDFTSWTLGGNLDPVLSDQGVDAADAYSGTYGAYLHATAAPTTLKQTISTVAGARYSVSFWLANDVAADPSAGYMNAVNVSFGTGGFHATNQDVFGYTGYQFFGAATSASTLLEFSLQNDAGYYSLDSIQATSSPSPEPANLLLIAPGLGALYLARKRKMAGA